MAQSTSRPALGKVADLISRIVRDLSADLVIKLVRAAGDFDLDQVMFNAAAAVPMSIAAMMIRLSISGAGRGATHLARSWRDLAMLWQ